MQFNILGPIINQFVNGAWKTVYQEIVREAKPIWDPIAISIFNEAFSFIKLEL